MDPCVVTIKYSPVKWAQAHNEENQSLSNYDNFLKNNEQRSESPSKNSASHYYCRRKHIQALSSLGFHKPTEDSIKSMRSYIIDSSRGEISFKEIEKDWYGDLINVAQRLKLLRDAYKVIQTVRKKKALGINVDFKPVYDTKTSRNDSPSHLDDESRPHKTDDEDEYKVREYPPPTRRGRPRKKRGRERKPTTGRGDARAAAATRTRISRRQLDRSALPQASTPRRNGRGTTPLSLSSAGPLTSVKTEQNSLALSPPQALQLLLNLDSAGQNLQLFGSSQPTLIPEPQGPPLMYLPPILPSQRHHLVHGIPPYRHMKEIEAGMSLGGAAVVNSSQNIPMKESTEKHQAMPKMLSELRSDQKSLSNESGTYPRETELSDVFKQLAREQSHLSSQSEPASPYVASETTVLPSLDETLTGAPKTNLNYAKDVSRNLASEKTISTTPNSQSTPASLEKSSTELNEDPLFEGNWQAPKGDSHAQSTSSDRSFINRLLN